MPVKYDPSDVDVAKNAAFGRKIEPGRYRGLLTYIQDPKLKGPKHDRVPMDGYLDATFVVSAPKDRLPEGPAKVSFMVGSGWSGNQFLKAFGFPTDEVCDLSDIARRSKNKSCGLVVGIDDGGYTTVLRVFPLSELEGDVVSDKPNTVTHNDNPF